METPQSLFERFKALVVEHGGSAEHPTPAPVWSAFVEMLTLPAGWPDPPSELGADEGGLDILCESDGVQFSVFRTLTPPWSPENLEPYRLGADFQLGHLDGVEELSLFAETGTRDPSAPLMRERGAGWRVVAAGRLAEAVAGHPGFERVLAAEPTEARLFLDSP